MARNRGNVRYTRRTESSIRRSEKITAVIIVAVFIVICTIVSVLIGIALGNRADKYKSESKYDFSADEYKSGEKTVKSVDAFVYALGTDAKGYIGRGVSDFSVCLRDVDGNMTYFSQVLSEAGVTQGESGIDLSEEADYLHGFDGYICAYIYADSFKCEDEYLREMYKARELALINEASECGVDDILILGIDVSTENIDEVEKYVNDASFAAGKAPVGVALSREIVLMTEDDIYLASRLRAVCDYLALDLRGLSVDADKTPDNAENEDTSAEGTGGEEKISELDALIEEMKYYIESYPMRIILSRENSSLYDSAKELGVVNIQIVND